MFCIVDANVLLPVLDATHLHRAHAMDWWVGCADESVGLCTPVRMALLRLMTNTRVMGSYVLPPEQAWEAMARVAEDPRIVPIEQVPQLHRRHWYANIVGRAPNPDLWMDAWLAALAQSMSCEFVTFDRGFLAYQGLQLRLLDGRLP